MNKCLLLLAGFVLFAFSPLIAQRQQPQEVLKILGISIEGNTLADPAAVIANSGLKVGDEITIPGDQVAQAIRKLWLLNIFSDVQIEIDRKVGNGVYLVYKVTELPRYDGI